MSGGKTGTGMGGRMEYTRNVKPIPCDCWVCFHARRLNGRLFCGYYQRCEPSKRACARFQRVKGKNLRPKAKRPPKRGKSPR